MNERDRAIATLPAAALTFRSCLTDREREKDRESREGGEDLEGREREREGVGGAVDYSTRIECVCVCLWVQGCFRGVR